MFSDEIAHFLFLYIFSRYSTIRYWLDQIIRWKRLAAKKNVVGIQFSLLSKQSSFIFIKNSDLKILNLELSKLESSIIESSSCLWSFDRLVSIIFVNSITIEIVYCSRLYSRLYSRLLNQKFLMSQKVLRSSNSLNLFRTIWWFKTIWSFESKHLQFTASPVLMI